MRRIKTLFGISGQSMCRLAPFFYAAIAVACAIYLAMVFQHDPIHLWLYDFRIFHGAGRHLLAGETPYSAGSGFFSPLPLAVLYAPFALLPLPASYAAFILVSLALLYKTMGRRSGWALLSFPVLFVLFVGQVDLFLTLAAAAFGPLSFPLLLGKPQVAFVAVPWLLVRSNRRQLMLGIALSAVMLLICFWLRPGWIAEMRAAAPALNVYVKHDSNLYRLVPVGIRTILVWIISPLALAFGALLRLRRDSWAVLHLLDPITNVYSAAALTEWIGPLEMLLSWAGFLVVGKAIHHGAPLYFVGLAVLARRFWDKSPEKSENLSGGFSGEP